MCPWPWKTNIFLYNGGMLMNWKVAKPIATRQKFGADSTNNDSGMLSAASQSHRRMHHRNKPCELEALLRRSQVWLLGCKTYQALDNFFRLSSPNNQDEEVIPIHVLGFCGHILIQIHQCRKPQLELPWCRQSAWETAKVVGYF